MREYVKEYIERGGIFMADGTPQHKVCDECGRPLKSPSDIRVGTCKVCTDFTDDDLMPDDWENEHYDPFT